MAYTTINKSTDYFNTKPYTGTGSSQGITGVGFQPDFTWIKSRSTTHEHKLIDAIRGVTKALASDNTTAEFTDVQGLTAFGSDGYTIGTDSYYNTNGHNYASWNWKGNGSGSANTDGTISSTVSANTTAGFSIVKWTATNANGATIGHGLGTTPAIVITKRLNSTGDWLFGGSAIDTARGGANSLLLLNTTAAMDNNSEVYQTFSSTTFQVGVNAGSFANGATLISYCFADVQGYSKFGSYVGNGNADGTFVYTGFKPAWVMMKKTNNTNSANWLMLDNKRNPSNVSSKALNADITQAEINASWVNTDILSNGFKFRTTDETINNGSYIYMAFGQSLVGSNNVPCTAR